MPLVATFDDVRRVALGLPGVAEGPGLEWGLPKAKLVWERPLRKGDLEHLGADAPTGDVLGIRTASLEAKDEVLRTVSACFTTPHFDGWPAVLCVLADLSVDYLTELVTEAWRSKAGKRALAAWEAAR